jgi:predicted RND superfamily exporter protein
MISLYVFFRKHPVLLYGLLIVSSLLFVYFGSKVEYEEDVSKLLPSIESDSSEGLVFANLKVKDKIFLLFIPKTDAINTETLTEQCSLFVERLLQQDSLTNDIQNILYQIDNELLMSGMAFLYDHAPVFIDAAMYPRIEHLLTAEAISSQMAANYEMIVSPSGMVFGNMVRQDPIGLRTLLMNDGSLAESFGGNYQIVYQHFFTSDTTVALAFLSPNFKGFDSMSGTRLVSMIEKEIVAFTRENPDIEILFHGAPVRSVFNSRRIKQDIALTLGLSLLIVCCIIGFCLRAKSALFMLVAPVVYGAFFALTGMYLIQGKMSLMALGIGAIILGVGLSYCLHVLTHHKYVNDPVQVLKDQTTPIFIACLTTVGAFMGMMFTQSALLRDFGLFSSLALIGTAAFCLIFMPHFFSSKHSLHSEKAFARLSRINSYPIDRKKWLIIAIFVVGGICLYTSRWVTFDADLKNIGYYDPDVERSANILASKTTKGYETLYYAATSHELDSALLYSGQMAAVFDSLKRNGMIHGYSQTATLLIPKQEQMDRIERWHDFWTAERIAETRQRLIEAGQSYGFRPTTFDPFFEMIEKEVEPVSVYDSGILPEALISNIIEYTDNKYMVFTSVQMSPDKMGAVSDMITARPHCVVIDPFYYTKDMVQMMNEDFNMILVVSSFFVFLVLLLWYRNVFHAVLAFIPMGLSWYIVLGVMGICGMQFNLINIVISSFIFGLGVDYSIFVMDGLLTGMRRNDDNLLTYHKTAIFFSAIVLTTAIASLMFATHPAIRSIGLVTLIGMSSTGLIAYTVTPFLFRQLTKFPNLNKKLFQ